MRKILFISLALFLIACTKYDYEVCEQTTSDYSSVAQCERVSVNEVEPSKENTQICSNDKTYIGTCEFVPTNRLLLKEGTNKTFCSDAPFLESDYVDNYWNAEGLVDECEMPIGANMQFIFKQHDQSIRSYSGVIQVKIYAINYDDDYKALQVFTAEDNNNDNLPDEWLYCGNVDRINAKDKRIINCGGDNLKFVQLKNAAWNSGNLYIDLVEVLKA